MRRKSRERVGEKGQTKSRQKETGVHLNQGTLLAGGEGKRE